MAGTMASPFDCTGIETGPDGVRRYTGLPQNLVQVLRAAVDRIGGRAEAEGSGGMDLATVRAAAEAGLDCISVGALTHSAPVLDLSLLLEPLP